MYTVSEFNRHIPFDHIHNFRDLGGYVTADNHTIKPGILYRSGQPELVTNADKIKFNSLSIKVVHDLRLQSEIIAANAEQLPNARTEYYDLQVSDIEPFYKAIRMGMNAPSAEKARNIMITGYKNSITNESQRFSTLLKNLAIKSEDPVLIHCAAGKDRTGIAVALILLTLGIERETIITDYLLTNELYPSQKEIIKKVETLKLEGAPSFDHSILAPLHTADPVYISTSLDRIESELGGLNSYMKRYLSLSGNDIDKLRRRFLLL